MLRRFIPFENKILKGSSEAALSLEICGVFIEEVHGNNSFVNPHNLTDLYLLRKNNSQGNTPCSCST